MKSFTTRIASHAVVVFVVAALLLCSTSAQQSSRPEPLAPHARLMAARSIYIEHAGSPLANDVIGDAFHGWGRYIVVAEPAQADLIVSINASADSTQIVLSVLDAHDRVVLWSGSERPKSSLKQKQREDNIVEASLRLFRRFRNVIEPEPKP